MINRILKKTISLFLAFLVAPAVASVAFAQMTKLPEPARRERLLNGLRVLIFDNRNAATVTVKLRINSGTAFDPKDKEGTMRLLADALLPGDEIKKFFAEDLGGAISAEANLDYIEITATGKADEFQRILDTVRADVVNAPLTRESFAKLRDARLKTLQAKRTDAGAIADNAVRRRLFGAYFPYGRSVDGTSESLARIEYADLVQARDRFLTADNAALVIAGNVDPAFAFRAARQFFGGWQKADKPVPPTFRQPDEPEKTVQIVRLPGNRTGEIRFAIRGAARGNNELNAEIAADLLQERWQKSLPEALRATASVRHEPQMLPGITIFGISIPGGFAESELENTQKAFAQIFAKPVAPDEFERAKTTVAAKIENKMKSPEAIAEFWLDADTYKRKNAIPTNDLNAAAVVNVQSIVTNWSRQTPAVVMVTQAEGPAR